MRAQLLTELIKQLIPIKEDLGLPIPPICRHLEVNLTPHEGATLELVGVEREEGGGVLAIISAAAAAAAAAHAPVARWSTSRIAWRR